MDYFYVNSHKIYADESGNRISIELSQIIATLAYEYRRITHRSGRRRFPYVCSELHYCYIDPREWVHMEAVRRPFIQAWVIQSIRPHAHKVEFNSKTLIINSIRWYLTKKSEIEDSKNA